MTTATITFTDNSEDGLTLSISIDFGEGGPSQDSIAHLAAAKAYVDIGNLLKEKDDEPTK